MKRLFVIFLAVLLLVLSCFSVFASEGKWCYTFEGVNYHVYDIDLDYPVRFLYQDLTTGQVHLVYAKGSPVVRNDSSGTFMRVVWYTGDFEYNDYVWGEDSTWQFVAHTDAGKNQKLIWCNKDLKKANGDLLYTTVPLTFMKAPPQLPKVVRAETMTGVLTEIIMILPIGMACLISYEALRKGLLTLRTILFRA